MAKRVQCMTCFHMRRIVNLTEESSDEKCGKNSPLFNSNSDENCDFYNYKPQEVVDFCGFCQANTRQFVVGKQTLPESDGVKKKGEVYQVLKCDTCGANNFGERLE